MKQWSSVESLIPNQSMDQYEELKKVLITE